MATETATRRQMTVESQLAEDEAARQERLRQVEERAERQRHVQEVQRAFFCEVRAPRLGKLVRFAHCMPWPFRLG